MFKEEYSSKKQKIDSCFLCFFKPFLANVSILYPLKTPENLWFSGIFRGYKMGLLARNGLGNFTAKCQLENASS